MCLQDTTLKIYKEKFPNDKLREISEKTGIQITRVFRILNGSEMKLKEFEAFQNVLKENLNQSEIIQLSKSCLQRLSVKRKKQIVAYMKNALRINALSKSQYNKHFDKALA